MLAQHALDHRHATIHKTFGRLAFFVKGFEDGLEGATHFGDHAKRRKTKSDFLFESGFGKPAVFVDPVPARVKVVVA